jgi:hypothetical protein
LIVVDRGPFHRWWSAAPHRYFDGSAVAEIGNEIHMGEAPISVIVAVKDWPGFPPGRFRSAMRVTDTPGELSEQLLRRRDTAASMMADARSPAGTWTTYRDTAALLAHAVPVGACLATDPIPTAPNR